LGFSKLKDLLRPKLPIDQQILQPPSQTQGRTTVHDSGICAQLRSLILQTIQKIDQRWPDSPHGRGIPDELSMGRWRLYAHEQATRTHRTRALEGQMHSALETCIRQIGTRAVTHRTVTPYRDHRTTIIDDTNGVNDAPTDRQSLGAFSYKTHIHPRARNT
jgi:hypothetical protein